MPYTISAVDGGFHVKNKQTGATYSKKPFKTKAEALAQLRAIEANSKGK